MKPRKNPTFLCLLRMIQKHIKWGSWVFRVMSAGIHPFYYVMINTNENLNDLAHCQEHGHKGGFFHTWIYVVFIRFYLARPIPDMFATNIGFNYGVCFISKQNIKLGKWQLNVNLCLGRMVILVPNRHILILILIKF